MNIHQPLPLFQRRESSSQQKSPTDEFDRFETVDIFAEIAPIGEKGIARVTLFAYVARATRFFFTPTGITKIGFSVKGKLTALFTNPATFCVSSLRTRTETIYRPVKRDIRKFREREFRWFSTRTCYVRTPKTTNDCLFETRASYEETIREQIRYKTIGQRFIFSNTIGVQGQSEHRKLNFLTDTS